MSKPHKKGLVPTLRFPEFQDAGAWEKKVLKSYIEQYSEKVSSITDLEIYSSTREGLKPQSAYYDGRNLVNDGEYGVVPHGYFVYRHMSDDDIFKFNINKLGKKIAVSKEYPVFRTINLASEFLLNQFNEGQDFKKFAASQKKGGTRTRLYFNTLCSFKSLLPSLDEQQKIADCLTSIDDLITAETQKLAALKTHKKGLIQQLFPAEGETVPILRFPEFRDDWKKSKLEKHINLLSGYAFKSEYFCGNGKKLLTPKNFTKNGAASFCKENIKFTTEECDSRYVCKEGDLLLLLTDLTPSCELLGKPIFLTKRDGESLLNQRIVKVIPKNEVTIKFLLYFFLTDLYSARIKDTATGSTVRHSSNKIVLDTDISFPSVEEQQKIADCLSSVDALIAAQGEKIEALKLHKKGLMQQLFPVMEEVDA